MTHLGKEKKHRQGGGKQSAGRGGLGGNVHKSFTGCQTNGKNLPEKKKGD